MYKQKLSDVINLLFPVQKEIPDTEMEFYEDQCIQRKLFIGPIDKKETLKENETVQEDEGREERRLKIKQDNERKKLWIKKLECRKWLGKL